jgi:glutaredoxin
LSVAVSKASVSSNAAASDHEVGIMTRAVFLLALAAGTLVAADVLAERSAQAAATVGATAHAVDVVMYATKDCPYCAKTREYLTEKGVKWDERDIDASPAAAAEFKAKGGVGTPLVLINGEKVVEGFDKAKLDEALKKTLK